MLPLSLYIYRAGSHSGGALTWNSYLAQGVAIVSHVCLYYMERKISKHRPLKLSQVHMDFHPAKRYQSAGGLRAAF